MLQQTTLDVTIELAFRSFKRQEKLEAKDTSSSRSERLRSRMPTIRLLLLSGGRCASSTTFRPSYLSKKETACVRAEGATVSSVESRRGCVHISIPLLHSKLEPMHTATTVSLVATWLPLW